MCILEIINYGSIDLKVKIGLSTTINTEDSSVSERPTSGSDGAYFQTAVAQN